MSDLREKLQAAQVAISAALTALGDDTIYLPNGTAVCRHEAKTVGIGGYWFCPDCQAEGREETFGG